MASKTTLCVAVSPNTGFNGLRSDAGGSLSANTANTIVAMRSRALTRASTRRNASKNRIVLGGASSDAELLESVTTLSTEFLAHHRMGVPKNDVKSTRRPRAMIDAIAASALACARTLETYEPPRLSYSIAAPTRVSVSLASSPSSFPSSSSSSSSSSRSSSSQS